MGVRGRTDGCGVSGGNIAFRFSVFGAEAFLRTAYRGDVFGEVFYPCSQDFDVGAFDV